MKLAGNKKLRLNWTQRIAAAIGVAKGIQFLHTGIVPGLFSNNLKITDVFLDHNLHVKISSFNLHLLAESKEQVWQIRTSYSWMFFFSIEAHSLS